MQQKETAFLNSPFKHFQLTQNPLITLCVFAPLRDINTYPVRAGLRDVFVRNRNFW
ncbi:MAG: hypothetical protein CLLPBCKN_005064 [Chroococcidiopsis cubana SAG 39.79]|jgi:hypothetical protein|nr:hypothetical protein [Chroococcidiopsis cubana SAG 39.79]